MNFKIEKEEVVFEDRYQMIKAEITQDTFGGGKMNHQRLAFHRGNSVAILMFEKDTQNIILTKQFRYPAIKNNDDWLLEIPAGTLEQGESPVNCMVRETLEETGYNIENPEKISSFYNSPGACTEKCFLYYTEVSKSDKIESGGGVDDENEDIQIVKLPVSEIKTWLSEKIIDAKTIIALQWFLMNHNTNH